MVAWLRARGNGAQQHRAIIGAARRVNLNRRSEVERLQRNRWADRWQQDAWRHYDRIGEIKFAFSYFANALSRVRFFAGWVTNESQPPVPIGEVGDISRSIVVAARDEMNKLGESPGGMPGLIRTMGLHLKVPGEFYLVEQGGTFNAYSTSELRIDPGGQAFLYPRRDAVQPDLTPLAKDTYIARVWTPHPEYSDESDSSLRGVADACDEVILLSRMIRNSAQSQLNAGLLLVAEELKFERAQQSDQEGDEPDEGETDPFEEELITTLTEPIDVDGSSSGINPLLARVPAEMIEKAIVKIDLSRPFDKTAVELRKEALDRVFNGMDVPRDLVTGFANMKYSNATVITEDLYKSHVEPAALHLAEALAAVRLRPALQSRGVTPDVLGRIVVGYDASEVVTRPDRSQDADAGHDRILIKDATWRRTHGFSDQDKPDDEEYARRLAAKNPFPPEAVVQVVAALVPEIAKAVHSAVIPTADTVRTIDGSTVKPTAGDSHPPGGAPAPSSTPAPPQLPPTPPTPTGTSSSAPIAASANGGHSNGHRGDPVRLAHADQKQLLEIERRLRAQVHTLLTDTLHQSLDKAGSRLVSKVRGDLSKSERIKNVPKARVASVLGATLVAAAGYDDQQLVQDSADQAEPRYKQLLQAARQQASKVLGTPVGNDADDDASWKWLLPLFVRFAIRAMYDRSDDVPGVPNELVRDALARAGGNVPTSNQPAGGAVFNDTARIAVANKRGVQQAGYRWAYGISDNHFMPHLELDGREFSSWTDPVLVNLGSWPKTTHYFCGDHAGCACDWETIYEPIPEAIAAAAT